MPLCPSRPYSPALVCVDAGVVATPAAGPGSDAGGGSTLGGGDCLVEWAVVGDGAAYHRVNAGAAIVACDGDRDMVRAS